MTTTQREATHIKSLINPDTGKVSLGKLLNQIDDLQFEAEKADAVLDELLQHTPLVNSIKAMQNDPDAQALFAANFGRIQTMLYTVFDYLVAVKCRLAELGKIEVDMVDAITDTGNIRFTVRSLQGDFNDLTNRLQEARILLTSVCTNYFEADERNVTPHELHNNYREFSSNVRLATGLLFDLEKDCLPFHDRMYCDLFPEEKQSPEMQRMVLMQMLTGMSDAQLDLALAVVREAVQNG